MPDNETKEGHVRLSRYLVVLCAIWVIAMTWRIYPQFKDTLRVDGRLTSLSDYVEASCGERIGPAAASCLVEARSTGRRLVANEEARSLLLIEAPFLVYLVLYLPLRRAIRRRSAGADGIATQGQEARP
jgi:hypothetical protein